jgi:single-strand DNA-binding protein
VNATQITVVGNVVDEPRHIISAGGVPITSFRVASTQRRFDRTQQQWVDSDTAWLGVTCFRGLALNAGSSLHKGQRVIVQGRLRTPQWTDAQGVRRTRTEIEAHSLGHDLSFGTTSFTRVGRSDRAEVPGRAEADELARAIDEGEFPELQTEPTAEEIRLAAESPDVEVAAV